MTGDQGLQALALFLEGVDSGLVLDEEVLENLCVFFELVDEVSQCLGQVEEEFFVFGVEEGGFVNLVQKPFQF